MQSILLVDDNPTFCRIIEQYIGTHPQFEGLVWAQNGKEAIDQARQMQPDIVLLDLGMPDVSGLEVLPILRSMLPKAVIIVVTLLDTESYRQAALQAGASGFVPKSKLNAELITAIENSSAAHQTENEAA